MGIPESSTFKDESSLLGFLESRVSGDGTKTALMAGHYMLMYDEDQNQLIPMVWQDATNPTVEKASKDMAGDFPLRSFKYGLDLWKKGQEQNSHVEIVLLINDHQFQSSYFRNNYDQPKGRGGELRKEYYRRSNNFPQSFRRLLSERGLEKSTVMLSNNDADRDDHFNEHDATILPPESVFFSEQHLRRRFDRRTRKELSKDPCFEINRLSRGCYDLFYLPEGSPNRLCLTDPTKDEEDSTETDCGCSGEVIQFLIELNKRGFTNAILFVPTECARAVNSGVQAALYTVDRYHNSQMKVATVTGIGGMGSFDSREEPPDMEVKEHTLEASSNV
jgi:hypothetical protein